jgi:hypothetical protein
MSSEGCGVIRQAISCDICASEKRQTNHWFVAYEQGGELRVSGWSSRHKLRPGSKHLCGQTCLHKLVDEFIAKAMAVRAQRPVEEANPEPPAACDASLISDAAYLDLESSARILTPAAPAVAPAAPPSAAPALPVYRRQPAAALTETETPLPPMTKPGYRPQPELGTMPPRPRANEFAPVSEEPRFASRNWRAAAWEREREREMRAVGNRPGIASHRASNA